MVTVSLLGVAQDGGRPQVGCFKSCCENLKEEDRRYPVCLGIVGDDCSRHLVEASRLQLNLWPTSFILLQQFLQTIFRHLGEQLASWRGYCMTCVPCGSDPDWLQEPIKSVFITHAHAGHIGNYHMRTVNIYWCTHKHFHLSNWDDFYMT